MEINPELVNLIRDSLLAVALISLVVGGVRGMYVWRWVHDFLVAGYEKQIESWKEQSRSATAQNAELLEQNRQLLALLKERQ